MIFAIFLEIANVRVISLEELLFVVKLHQSAFTKSKCEAMFSITVYYLSTGVTEWVLARAGFTLRGASGHFQIFAALSYQL